MNTYRTIKANPNAKIIIHARHVMSSFISAFICKLLNRDYILVEHTADTSFMSSKLTQMFVQLYEKTFAKFVVRNAHKIIAVSEASVEFLKKEFEAEPSNISITTNGFEPSQIGKVKFKNKENIALFASKWIKVKDPVTTFNAFKKIANQYPEWTFLLIGEGSEKIEDKTLPRNVRIINRVLSQEEFLKTLKKTKIYVNSSLSEGFPLAVAEAAATGNLLVLSDAPTNISIARELRQTDYLFERGDSNSLSIALKQAITDSEDLNNLKSVKRLSSKYSLEKILPKFAEEVFDQKDYRKLSIVIPVYNEQKTIQRLLGKVAAADLGQIEKEIIIVDDGSKDKSRGRIDAFISKNPELNIKFILNKKNLGKSQTVKRGLLESTGDLVVIQDADLEYDPKDLTRLVRSFNQESEVKVIYGNRFNSKNGIIYLHFFLGNLAVTAFANLFTLPKGLLIKDMEVCYKMFEGELIRKIAGKIESTSNFGFEPEVTARVTKEISKKNFRNIDISYNPRTVEEGKKIRVVDGLKAIKEILHFNLKNDTKTLVKPIGLNRSMNYLRSIVSGLL